MIRSITLVLLTLATAAYGTEKKFDCDSFLRRDLGQSNFSELEVDFDSEPKTVWVLGPDIDTPNVRNILADMEFEVIGPRLTMKSFSAPQIRNQDFTDLMLSRTFAHFKDVREVSDVLVGDDLEELPAGLNRGLTLEQAVAQTHMAAVYRKFGFTKVITARLRFDANNTLSAILIDAVFARER